MSDWLAEEGSSDTEITVVGPLPRSSAKAVGAERKVAALVKALFTRETRNWHGSAEVHLDALVVRRNGAHGAIDRLKCRFFRGQLIGVLIITAMLSGRVACLAADKDNPTSETSPEQVKLMNLYRVLSPHGELNVIQVQYDFPGKQQVVASSHGLVSGKGTLKFLTTADRLEFRDSSSNTLLAAVSIDKTIKLMGRKETPIPLERDFPSSSLSAQWNKRLPFADNLISVLNQEFPTGYLADLKKEERIFITNYKVINDPAANEEARVAAMIKVPSSHDSGKSLSFQVHFLAQERRSRTDWRRAESEAVTARVQKFVSQLIRELAEGQ